MHTPLLAVKPEGRRMSGNICLHGRYKGGMVRHGLNLYGLDRENWREVVNMKMNHRV
jgi:alanine racemase